MYYYGNWDASAVKNINLSLAIAVGWHSAKMAEYGIMASRAAERTFHPTREQLNNSWRSLIGVAVNVVVFAGCSAVTAPETAGLSIAACGALAGAAGGGVPAAVNDETSWPLPPRVACSASSKD